MCVCHSLPFKPLRFGWYPFDLHFSACGRQAGEGPTAWEVKVMQGLLPGRLVHAVSA